MQSTQKMVWELKTGNAAWSRRDSAGKLVYDGRMWLLGGYTPKRVNDVWFSKDGLCWKRATKAAAWGERNLPSCVVFDNKMWIMGGAHLNGKSSYNDVWYSADGVTWELALEHAPWQPRIAATALAFQNKIWIMGGFDFDTFVHYNDVWYSSDGHHWELATEHAPWSVRGMHGSVVFNDKIWIIGGGIYNTAYPNNTVADYGDVWNSSDGEKWELAVSTAEWITRRFHSSVVYDGKIWIIAGYHYGNRNDVWSSSDGKCWQEVQIDPKWAIRHEPMCLVFDDRLWMMGGCGDRLYNDIWTYTKPRTNNDLGIQESAITRDLEHIAKSLRARGQVLLVRPAACVRCGFKFRHSKARWPGKCPSCRSTRISPPGFKIVSPQGRHQLEKPSQTVE